MKLSLRKSERTWGVRSLVAVAVAGALSLTQFANATIGEATTELNLQLALKGKPQIGGTAAQPDYKALKTAIAGALKTPASSPYLSGTATPNLTGQRVRDLISVATSTDPVGIAEYIKYAFLGDAKLPKTNAVNYPAGALSTAADIQGAVNDAFAGYATATGTAVPAALWSQLAVNAGKGKKLSLALTQQLFSTNYPAAPSDVEIQAAMKALVKIDKSVGVDVLKKALTLQPTAAVDIYKGAFAGDTGGRAYLVAAAVADDPASIATILTDANADGKLKTPNGDRAAEAAKASVEAGSTYASGTAVAAKLVGADQKYVPEIIGGGVIANPDAANQIVNLGIKKGDIGDGKNWAKHYGAKMVTSAVKYSELIRRAANPITVGPDTFTGAAEAAAVIVEQSIYSAQSASTNLTLKDKNSLIPKLVSAAMKAVLKTDFDPATSKRQANADVLAGAAVGGIVAVTGTGLTDVKKKPINTFTGKAANPTNDTNYLTDGYFNIAMAYAVTNAAIKAVKKNQTQTQTVLEAVSQAIGYIVGQYGGQAYSLTLRDAIAQAAKDAKPVNSLKVELDISVLQGYVETGYQAGLAGTAGTGAYGTRDTGTGDYYGTYWTALGTPNGTPVTDISGL